MIDPRPDRDVIDPRVATLINELVRSAPSLDAAVATELVERLRAIPDRLAHAIARIAELVAEDLVDPGIALPPLAMACATLADPRLGARERDAARYEIETLLPVPDPPARVVLDVDVPVTALNRGPRPRT